MIRIKLEAWRPILLGALILVSILWLPWDLRGILAGGSWQLSVGLFVKLFFTAMALVGLFQDRPYGWVFLLALSGQCLLIDYGTLSAVWPVWDGIWAGEVFRGLVIVVADAFFRGICCIYGVAKLASG